MERWGEKTDNISYAVASGVPQLIDLAGAKSILVVVTDDGADIAVTPSETDSNSGYLLRRALTSEPARLPNSIPIPIEGNPAIWLHADVAGPTNVNVLRFYED